VLKDSLLNLPATPLDLTIHGYRHFSLREFPPSVQVLNDSLSNDSASTLLSLIPRGDFKPHLSSELLQVSILPELGLPCKLKDSKESCTHSFAASTITSGYSTTPTLHTLCDKSSSTTHLGWKSLRLRPGLHTPCMALCYTCTPTCIS
jgi:hypothetical protein